jgi:hypothetical protein
MQVSQCHSAYQPSLNLTQPLGFQISKLRDLPDSEHSTSHLTTYRNKIHTIPPGHFKFETSVREMIGNANLRIESASSGVNKVPILYDNDNNIPIAVFKENGSFWSTVNDGDLIAYKLDHNAFAKVPLAFRMTQLPKDAPQKFLSGVFVKWIPNSRDMTTTEQLYANSEERQAISILDMRLGNNDRNIGNIQIDKDGNLIPIDHDRTFTNYETYKGACYKDIPLMDTSRDYITNLDINQDVGILREHQIDEIEISNFVIRTTLIKLAADECVNSDLTIGEIEEVVEYSNLPTGRIGGIINKWIYHHPLHTILDEYSEPYSEAELKLAFKNTFNEYLSAVRNHFFHRTVRRLYC